MVGLKLKKYEYFSPTWDRDPQLQVAEILNKITYGMGYLGRLKFGFLLILKIGTNQYNLKKFCQITLIWRYTGLGTGTTAFYLEVATLFNGYVVLNDRVQAET